MRKFSGADDDEEKKDSEYDKPASAEGRQDYVYSDLLDQLVKFSSDRLT